MDLLLCDYDLEHGKSRGVTVPWDKLALLVKNPLAGAYLPADQARSFKSRHKRNLFITLDRPDVQFASKEISRAMAQPTINADETLNGACPGTTSQRRGCCGATRDSPFPSKIVGLGDANWAGCPVTRRKSSGYTHLMLGRDSDLCRNHDPSCDLSLSSEESELYAAVRRACRILGLAALMLDVCFSVQAELCADSAAAKGLASDEELGRYDTSTAQLYGCNKQSHDGKSESRNKLDRHSQVTLKTTAGIPAQKMWDLLTRVGCQRSAGRADVALENA